MKTITKICITVLGVFVINANSNAHGLTNTNRTVCSIKQKDTNKANLTGDTSCANQLMFEDVRMDVERINDIIQAEIKYPAFAKTNKISGIVCVGVNVSKSGQLKVEELNGNNPELNNYVKANIENLYILPSDEASKMSYYKFYFNLLN